MDLLRAFIYVFDDPDWLSKLVMVGLLSFLSAILMPLLGLGLVPLALLMGYLAQIAANVRDGTQHPLPVWADYGAFAERGTNVLIAVVVYHLPVALMTCCIMLVPSAFGGSLTTGLVSLVSLCCLLPVLLIYTGIMWPVLAAGIDKYTRTGHPNSFFQPGQLYDSVQAAGVYSIQFLLAVVGVNLILWLIPCFGWIAALVVGVPAFGHLTGQYARRLKPGRRRA